MYCGNGNDNIINALRSSALCISSKRNDKSVKEREALRGTIVVVVSNNNVL
jgi:hypothetical protein